ncbi:MAG: hypothetical protein K0B06_07260 [Brevefilum sp.]|nr:hypothetical protein [Brevefilum sp.]
MGALDVFLGVVTGGAYTAAKGIYDVSSAASKAGSAAKEIGENLGTAIASITAVVTQLGTDLSSFITEMEDLLTVKRVTPRDEDDLWDEEVKRLNALRTLEAQLVQELADLGADNENLSLMDIFFNTVFGKTVFEELILRAKLAVVREAINEILYEEPGVIPSSIHNLQFILERFNTLEQPRIEEILDSVNNNLDQSEELIKEVNKLFVVKTWKKVPQSELSQKQLDNLESLESSLSKYEMLISKNKGIAVQLKNGLVEVQPSQFEIASIIGIPKVIGTEQAKPGKIIPAADSSNKKTTVMADKGPSGVASIPQALPVIGFKDKINASASQPMATNLSVELNHNIVSGVMDNYILYEGRINFYMREKIKVEKDLFKIKYEEVEEPGVIPRILEEIRKVLNHFHTNSQPRVDLIFDNVNNTIVESTSVLANVNTSLESLQSFFGFLAKYNLLFKIGLAVVVGLSVVILLMSAIVLFRLAFGI